MDSVQLVDEIRGALAAAGDPGKAAREQAYMKSALRQHARVDPDWVKAFVETRGSRLSGLSRREALKHL